jgi:hypothetical protein
MNIKTKYQKILNVESLLWIALALALVGSLKHLASVFASIDGNTFLGWVQGIAIDIGLFSLAYKIKMRRATKQSIKLVSFSVVLFTLISIYGNLTYGLQSLNNSLPYWIQVTKPVVLAATLPVLVLLLSHLLSDERQHAHELEKQQKQIEKTIVRPKEDIVTEDKTIVMKDNNSSQKDNNIDGRTAGKIERREQVLSMLNQNIDHNQIANTLGLSIMTVKRYIKELNGSAK